MNERQQVEGLVTTIIPVHNREDLLRDAVGSVLGQTHRPIEIIPVDDGPTDETGLVADALAIAHPNKVRAFHQPNMGSGLFVQYLDSDDVLLPRKFECQVRGLAERPEYGVAYGKTRFCTRGTLPGGSPMEAHRRDRR